MSVSRPAKLPRWADVSGTVVEPSEARKDGGWAASERPPAQWWNWLLLTAYQWLLWLSTIIDSNEEHVYQVAKSRTLKLVLSDALADTGWIWQFGGVTWQSNVNSATILLPLRLPHNAKITSLDVIVRNGAARATDSNRTKITLLRVNHQYASPAANTTTLVGGSAYSPAQVGATTYACTTNAAAGYQRLIISGMTEVVDNTQYTYYLLVAAGNDGGTNVDNFTAAQVIFDDPGPRNY